jgi:nitroimidazol reductase NimA-like FMN-containing flavoprotein (pyridoxamine 5'-phosphate oxidase superfamily)
MIDDEVSEQLAFTQTAWFSSVRPDHSPHTVPVWFVHDRTHLWVASSPSSRKVANVRHNDQVSLALDGSAAHAPYVALARAEIVADLTGQPDVVAAIARKYGGYDVSAGSGTGPLVLMRLTITRWLLDGSVQ